MSTANESAYYLAYVLSNACRERLVELYRPKFQKLVCRHITLWYPTINVSYQDLERMQIKLMNTVKPGSLASCGYAEGFGIDCAAVTLDDSMERIDGGFYHVTLSRCLERADSESNQLRSSIVTGTTHPLDGTFELIKKRT